MYHGLAEDATLRPWGLRWLAFVGAVPSLFRAWGRFWRRREFLGISSPLLR